MTNKGIKKCVSFLVTLCLIASIVLQNNFVQKIEATATARSGEVGDANQDGSIDILDLISIKKNAENAEERYDLDNSKSSDDKDADLMREFLVGKICSFYRPDISTVNNDSYLYTVTDGLDREMTSTGVKKDDKAVGIRYFLHFGTEENNPLYSTSKILEKDAAAFKSSGAWEAAGGGAVGTMHWWGESLFGYYVSMDSWVLERDVQMLTDAGIDFIAIDTTGDSVYEQQLTLLLQVLDKYYQQGFEVPKVIFTSVNSGNVGQVLQAFYNNESYRHLWYKSSGSIVRSVEELEVTAVRAARSVNNTAMSESAFYGELNNHQRTWDGISNSTEAEAFAEGYNFAYEFEKAIKEDPSIIYVESWNEWISERKASDDEAKPIVFTENADGNNSSDIQPMKGGYGDNYYMQLVNYIQQFKGSKVTNRKLNTAAATEGITIDISGDFSQWNKVNTHYLDYTGEISDRATQKKGYGTEKENKAAAIEINRINESAPMSFITREAYAGGSTISFKAYVPEEASWWSVCWTTSATEANDLTKGIWNSLYAHTKDFNGHKLGQAMTSVKGEWSEYSVTLPDDGNNYYVYIAGAKGEWKDSSNNLLSLLVDDFKVVSATGEILGEDDFEDGFDTGIFNVKTNAGVSLETSGSTVAPIDYADSTGRNDISRMKMTTDGTNLYCLVETEERIQGFGSANCMSLFISTGNVGGCRNQYEYVVNRDSSKAADGKLAVEKYTGGQWVSAGDAAYRMEGNKLHLAIPLSVLNCESTFSLEFKWADNYVEEDLYSFYTKGDAAPYGRLNYVYEVSDRAAAITIDLLNESKPMDFITSKAYPGGSTVSFKAYVPEGASWWSVGWTTSATEADDTTRGIYNGLYAHLKDFNEHKLGQAMTSVKGEWSEYSITLPDDGNNYYVYIAGAKGEWNASGKQLSLLIDDFTVAASDGEVIAKDTFHGGFSYGLFNVQEKASNGQAAVTLVSMEEEVPEQAASIQIDYLSETAPMNFCTKDAYPGGSTISFKAYVPEGASWWSVCRTTSATEPNDITKGIWNSLYAHAKEFNGHKLGQAMTSVKGEWSEYSVTLPDDGNNYYVYIAGAKGEWNASGKQLSLLIDDLKIQNASGELIAKDNFDRGFANGLFEVIEKTGNHIAVSLVEVPAAERENSVVAFTAYAAPPVKKN